MASLNRMNPITRRWARPPRLIFWLVLLLMVALLLSAGRLIRYGRMNADLLLLNKALASGETRALNQAVANLKEAVVHSPESHDAWHGIALAHMALGDLDAAATAWPHVEGFSGELLAWGARSERVEDWAGARDWYQVASIVAPQNGDFWYRLARASAQLGDDRAVEYYLRALSAPERVEFGRSNILTRLGEIEKRHPQPNWSEVLAQFDESIQVDDFVDERDIVQARQGKAEALERLGQSRAALDAYLWLAAYRPGHYWANVHSGRLLWQIEKNAAEAKAYLENAIAIDDESKWAFIALGLVYAESGNPEAARPLLQKALAIDPNDTTAKKQLEELAGDDGS